MSAETQSDRDRHLLVANFHELMEKDERIAELEAELAALRETLRESPFMVTEWRLRAEQAEAELEAVNARDAELATMVDPADEELTELKALGYCTNPQWDHGALCDRWAKKGPG